MDDIDRFKEKIESELKSYFKSKKKYAFSFSKEIYDAVEKLENFTLRGGKRIRSVLMNIGYSACGGKK
jgi:hypothetical protein